VAYGFRIDLGNVVNPPFLFPTAHLQAADDDDPLSLFDAAANVSGQLPIALNGKPVGVAIYPRAARAVVTAVCGPEAEGGCGDTARCGGASDFRGHEAPDRNVVTHLGVLSRCVLP
jgi:hypothetical protein